MKLFYSPASPYVRKVRVLALELGIDDRLKLITVDPRDPASGLAGQNPLSRVPTLITEGGDILFDSPVICEYLDALAGGSHLFPAPGPARWAALRRQAIGDGIMDNAVPLRAEYLRPLAQRSDEFIERMTRGIIGAVALLESRVAELEHFDIGTIAIGCALGYLDFRHQTLDWREHRPGLAAWYEKISARPSFAATKPFAPT